MILQKLWNSNSHLFSGNCYCLHLTINLIGRRSVRAETSSKTHSAIISAVSVVKQFLILKLEAVKNLKMDFEAEKDVNQALKNTEYNLEDEEKILRHVNEHFGQNPKTLEKLSWKDFVPLVKVLKRSSKAIASHFQTFLLPIMLASIYDSKDFNSNPEWKDEFFKYIIEEKVESISDIDWDHVLKEKPF